MKTIIILLVGAIFLTGCLPDRDRIEDFLKTIKSVNAVCEADNAPDFAGNSCGTGVSIIVGNTSNWEIAVQPVLPVDPKEFQFKVDGNIDYFPVGSIGHIKFTAVDSNGAIVDERIFKLTAVEENLFEIALPEAVSAWLNMNSIFTAEWFFEVSFPDTFANYGLNIMVSTVLYQGQQFAVVSDTWINCNPELQSDQPDPIAQMTCEQ